MDCEGCIDPLALQNFPKDPRGERRPFGGLSRQMRGTPPAGWDKTWNSAKGANLFATFLAMKRVMQKDLKKKSDHVMASSPAWAGQACDRFNQIIST